MGGAWELRDVKLWPFGGRRQCRSRISTARPAGPAFDADRRADPRQFRAAPTRFRSTSCRASSRSSTPRASPRFSTASELQMHDFSNPLMLSAMVLIGAGFTMRHTRFGAHRNHGSCGDFARFWGVFHPRFRGSSRGEWAVARPPSSRGRRRWRRSCLPWASCCIRKMGRGTDIIGRARRATAAALLAGTAMAEQPALPAIAQGAQATLIAERHPLRPGLGRDHRTGRRRGLLRRRAASRQLHHLFAGRRPDHGRRTADPDRPVGRRRDRRDFADLSADLRDGVLQSAIASCSTGNCRSPPPRSTAWTGATIRPTRPWPPPARSASTIPRRCGKSVPAASSTTRWNSSSISRARSFRVMGVPVIWLPQMRLPDPTLERATGFLAPLDPRHRHHGHADPRSLLQSCWAITPT